MWKKIIYNTHTYYGENLNLTLFSLKTLKCKNKKNTPVKSLKFLGTKCCGLKMIGTFVDT